MNLIYKTPEEAADTQLKLQVWMKRTTAQNPFRRIKSSFGLILQKAVNEKEGTKRVVEVMAVEL